MKKRSSKTAADRHASFKGVVKKIAGKLTSDPKLEQEGREEMLGSRDSQPSAQSEARRCKAPDPYRRG